MGFLSSILDPGASDRKDAARALASVPVPKLADLTVQLDQYVQQGVLTPAQAEAVLQEQTQYRQIEEDPRLRGSQLDALSELSGIVDAGGLDAQANANLYQIGRAQDEQARGAREAIQANARARGIGSSDLSLVTQQVADQAAASRGAQRGIDVAALREQRRAEALRDQANLAGSIRSQDYSRAADAAAAADSINRFNAQARQQSGNLNVQNSNIAQARNLEEKQRVADSNVDIRNRQETTNRQLPLDIFRAQRQSAGDQADSALREEQAKKDRLGSILGLAQSAAGAFALSDERAKKDIKPIDSRAVLEQVSGVKYRYKDPAHGDGERHGVLAQQIERIAPDAVIEGEDGMKRIDTQKMVLPVVAYLADVSKRLSAVEDRAS